MFNLLRISVPTFFHPLFRSGSIRCRWHHTIFSLSSGPGKCGVAVVRVSGPQSLSVLQALARFPASLSPRPRHAYLRALYDPRTALRIDRALALWFPSPHSFTGQDCCEFQVHGGPAVVAALLDALSAQPGCRQALAGEFSRRAFDAGKLDLTAAEGLADLIHAETEQQRRQALRQADGALARLYGEWRVQLMRALAHLEAWIDFSADQNIEPDTLERVLADVAALADRLVEHLSDGRRGERLRSGVRTVIAGAPNVGKSSFMNWLCGRPIAIVTDVPGTTRDLIETAFDVAGYPLVLCDTAGLRQRTDDAIEREGIERARHRLSQADLLVLVMDAQRCAHGDLRRCLDEYVGELDLPAEQDVRRVVLVNKIDLLPAQRLAELQADRNGRDVIWVSCLREIGIAQAVETIAKQLKCLCGSSSVDEESPLFSQQRHRMHAGECLQHLQQFGEHLAAGGESVDFAIGAHELRMALRALGRITGETSTEDILDVIFRDFCIGK